ncbi:Deoxycytidine kinase 1 [Teratosphaeriaceae sp. CCFEE 6253]|nr:Deoxycytidine kinase 1 [Teratosphaeriaceae sp. CCFEE 6253]
MLWKPLPSVAFAICVYPFRATHPYDLPLQVGDCLYIIEQGGRDGEWYRGYLVGFPSLLAGLTSARGEQLDARVFTGIFPRNCVEVREVMEDGRAATEQANSNDERDGVREKRKSQALHARRLSRALSRKRSAHDVTRKTPARLALDEPMPRDPDAPKPPAPVPTLRVGDETGLSAEEPLVDEIASCLREWHDARLHELILARGYSQLARVQELVKRLDVCRKQLMHDVMTMKELNKLREDTVWDLVAGNKMLSEDVIVRSATEKGRILTADDSVIEMTKLQANMSILDRPPKAPVDKNMLYHVLVDVRNLVCEYDQPATLQMHICTKDFGDKPRPLSENYAISIPLPEGASSSPEDQSKSLFVNLTANDIGIGSENTGLYVVFKLLKDEPIRLAPSGQSAAGHQHTASNATSNNSQKHGSVRGRRSVFGSQRKKDGHGRSSSEARPGTGMSDYSDAGRSSGSHSEAPPGSAEAKIVKRTVAVGAIDVGKLARNQSELERKVTMWAPSSPSEDKSDESDDWTEVVRELMRSPTGSFARVKAVKRFDMFATCFASADLDTLVRNTPTLLHNVHMTAKLGFSGVPAHKRSDIYLTLTEPVVPRQAHLAHSKFGNVPLSQRCQSSLANLQLTLEVRRADGERIDDCIFTASNHQGHTAWRTTGVERGEGWNQTIRLAIPAEDVPGSHIVMSIADSPNFPFALAWVPLWEFNAFVRDGDHSVALYVYDEYSSSIIGGKGAYLALPPWLNKSDAAHQNAAIVSLRTFLCSTEYSQDPTLLGLLEWRDLDGAKLIELLEHFAFVPEIEIVKLLSEVFAALFEVLNEYAQSEAYEDVVFQCFVTVLSIARDRRFNLTSVIEDYASTRHDWPYASRCLVRAFQRLLTNPLDPDASRKLRATLKVGDQMLRLILETIKQPLPHPQARTNGDSDVDVRHPDIEQDLQNLFVALMALMRNPMPVLLGTQTLVVQHFHTWLPELVAVMPPADILEIATNLLDACSHAQGKMVLYRLILVINYSHLEVFKPAEVRTTLIANTFRWLAPYWGDVLGSDGTVTEQWRNQVRLCCSVVAAQMEELGEESCQYVPKMVESFTALQKAPRVKKRTFSMLFPTSFPFPAKSTPAEVDVDEVLLELSALLAAALTTQMRLYFDASQIDIPGVLMQALKVGQSVLGCEAFPRSWVSLHVSHHRFAMTALERISEVLLDALPDNFAPNVEEAMDFDTEIWRAFFDTLFSAVSSPALAMETFPEQKRRAIWKIAGDVREMGARLLRRTWTAIGWETDEDSRRLHGFERMGGYQVQFVPELISPIVELCLSVHASLRAVAVEVLRSMIISTWEIDQDLAVIQTAMVECLDKLCRMRSVTESYLQQTFIAEMLDQFRPLRETSEDALHQAVVEMFGRIEDLLGMLANVHHGGTAVNEANQIVDTLRLMEFLEDLHSEDAYIRYVHQLADLQTKLGNYTEAGLALRLHAQRYAWDPSATVGEMADPKLPAHTAFERKEALYFEMCQHFERGQSWQRALGAYKELATQYELNTFDFGKLARAQRAMASIHERIAKGDRISPRYFRVVYKGLGFPLVLREKQFIFEGHATERLINFEDRLQALHPSAQIVRSVADTDGEGQYLQVFAVSPHKDLAHTVYQRTKVSQAAREHALLSNPQTFAQTTRHPAADVPIVEQQVEKTIYATAEAFPTILRRSEILSTENIVLDPVQAAVERTTRKTQEMLAVEKRISSGQDEGAMTQLSEMILQSVDAGSESSVARYRSLLPASEVPDDASQEVDLEILEKAADPPLDGMQNALKIALLDHALAVRRCLGLYNRSAFIATKAQLVPRFEASFGHELALLFPNSAGLMNEPSPRTTIDDPDAARPAPEVQASAGAQAEAARPASRAEDAPREGRRRSLPWLNRRGSSTLKQQTNGDAAAAAATNGRSESRTRSRSRLRDGSIPRRLSFFRGSEDKTRDKAIENGDGARAPGQQGGEHYRPSMQATTSGGSTNYSSMSTAQLKKRLSFLRNSGVPPEVTATGEYTGSCS